MSQHTSRAHHLVSRNAQLKQNRLRKRAILALALGVVVADMHVARAAVSTWNGNTNQDWNNAANWQNNTFPSGTFPDGTMTVNVSTGNFPIITATSVFTPTD